MIFKSRDNKCLVGTNEAQLDQSQTKAQFAVVHDTSRLWFWSVKNQPIRAANTTSSSRM